MERIVAAVQTRAPVEQHGEATKDQLHTEAAAARQSEQAHLYAVEGHTAEQYQDAGHAQQEASTGPYYLLATVY